MTPRTPWLYAAPAVKAEGPFYALLGVIFGLAQWVSYAWFQSNWGSDQVVEHYAVHTTMLLILGLIVARAALRRRFGDGTFPRVERLMQTISTRAAGLALASAAATAGFAGVAACFGAATRLPLFLLFVGWLSSRCIWAKSDPRPD